MEQNKLVVAAGPHITSGATTRKLMLGVVAALVLIKGLLKDGINLSASMPDGFDMVGIVIDPVMPMQLEPMHVIYAALLVIAITMIAALLPSWRVMRVKPAESMR